MKLHFASLHDGTEEPWAAVSRTLLEIRIACFNAISEQFRSPLCIAKILNRRIDIVRQIALRLAQIGDGSEYLRAALEHGWSQNVLVHMISGQLHEREGKALTNFKRSLPPPDSDMAQQILRDPYNFDFLTLTDPFAERELERGLLIHLRDLLLELGRGFAFVGSQVPLVVDDRSFYVDLLFYHVRLHCYFVIELKTGEFQPEYAGKLGFYLSAIDGTMRTPIDGPTIGLLLCESRSGPVVEYALQNLIQPIGVSTYRVTRELPEPVREELPSVEDLQEVVNKLRPEMETLRNELADEE